MPIATDSGYLPDWLKALLGQGSVAADAPTGLFSETAASPSPAVGLLSSLPQFTGVRPDAPAFQGGNAPQGPLPDQSPTFSYMSSTPPWGGSGPSNSYPSMTMPQDPGPMNIGPGGAGPSFTGVSPNAPFTANGPVATNSYPSMTMPQDPGPMSIGPGGAAPSFTGVSPNAPFTANGPSSVQDQYADVPLPPRRPSDPTSFQATTTGDPQDINAPPPGRPNANVIGTQASGAPEVTAQKSLGFGDYLGKAANAIGGIYGAGGPGDALIALGLSNRTNGASIQALNAGILNRSKQAELALKQAEANDKIKAIAGNVALVRKMYPNLSDEEISAFARNPAMMQEVGKAAAPMEQWTPLYKDADGNWLKKNTRTGDTQVVLKADPNWKDLTDPAERLAAGIRPSDTGVYQRSDTTNQVRNVNEHGVSLNTAVNPVMQTAGNVIQQGQAEAKSSSGTLMALSNARQELDRPGGIISGFGANQRLNWAKLGALFGLDPKKIQNTESFQAEMKPMVLETVKGLGAGVGISNADREFAEKAVGSDKTLDEGTLRRLLDVTERAARFKLERHNQQVDNFIGATPQGAEMAPYASILKVPMPEVYQTPQRPQAGGQKPFTWRETQ
jgi:hypothetical protein